MVFSQCGTQFSFLVFEGDWPAMTSGLVVCSISRSLMWLWASVFIFGALFSFLIQFGWPFLKILGADEFMAWISFSSKCEVPFTSRVSHVVIISWVLLFARSVSMSRGFHCGGELEACAVWCPAQQALHALLLGVMVICVCCVPPHPDCLIVILVINSYFWVCTCLSCLFSWDSSVWC